MLPVDENFWNLQDKNKFFTIQNTPIDKKCLESKSYKKDFASFIMYFGGILSPQFRYSK